MRKFFPKLVLTLICMNLALNGLCDQTPTAPVPQIVATAQAFANSPTEEGKQIPTIEAAKETVRPKVTTEAVKENARPVATTDAVEDAASQTTEENKPVVSISSKSTAEITAEPEPKRVEKNAIIEFSVKPTVPAVPLVLSSANIPIEKAGDQVLKDRPWMQSLYSWSDSFNLDKQSFKMNEAGSYCVGNGKTFALLGLSTPLWSWSNIYGDSYQEPDLGTMKMSVTRAGIDAWMPVQKIGWVKHSGVVQVHAEGKGIVVESYDFAPVTSQDEHWDNPAALVRIVHIVNTGDSKENDFDIAFKVTSSWNVKIQPRQVGNDLVMDQKATHAKKRTFWRLGSFGNRNIRIWDGSLHYSVPSLKPGQETWAAFFLTSARSSKENDDVTNEVRKQGALVLLDKTYSYYQNWFSKGAIFDGDPKIADLFDIESTIFKCQQSHSGGFSPLIGYSYTWIRDNNGPIRWFLKTGHSAEAKRAMDFFYGVGATMGSLPNSIRVDYPLDYHLKDLSTMHVEHAETPNWIVLQYWWYYLSTGDIDFVRSRWNYLKRCVLGQVNVDDQYFFHRDETYLWCLESRCFDQTPFPNYDLSTYAYATDSSFDLVSAAEHLAYMGKFMEMDRDVTELKRLADRVRSKAESTYWNEKAGYWAPAQSLLGPLYNAPFANVLFNPLWCGYARNDLDPLGLTPDALLKSVQAFKNAYPALGKKDGFWKTTPTMSFYVGMNPGQMLYDFCKARLAWAGKAYEAVLRTATPSGEFAEMYDGDDHPWNPPIWGIGASGRVRPWEGGLDTESILEYLLGFAPDAGNNKVVFSPHMPLDRSHIQAQNLMVGTSAISIDMKRNSKKEWHCVFHLSKGQPVEVIADFWADHNLLSNIEAVGTVAWDKTVVDGQQRDARCHFTLDDKQDVTFVIVEDSALPGDELNPPSPQKFEPEPYSTENASVLLMTSPSGIFNKHKNTKPDDFVKISHLELNAIQKVTKSVSFLDMDLPISAKDVANGLVDDKGLKVKIAVLGRGVFSSGKHHFKPVSYWADPQISVAVQRFIKAGGIFFIGPSFPNREILPDWMIALTHGGWEEGTIPDKAVIANISKSSVKEKLCDELSVDNPGSEKGHAVTFEGATFEETQKLPEGDSPNKLIEDKGRGFKGYYQFTMKTIPNTSHRMWIRVNTGHNIIGTALMVQVGEKWAQLGVRTQNDGTTRHFESLYFEVPAKYVTADKTTFKLVSKDEDDVNAYHLWIYKLDQVASQTLPEILGFIGSQDMGSVGHGLIPKSPQWKIPLTLSQHPDQAALMILKVGNGYLIRSEMAIEDSGKVLKSLLAETASEKLSQALGSGE